MGKRMPSPLEQDLVGVLRDIEWGSPEMARMITQYFKGLVRRAGFSGGMVLLNLSPTTGLGEFLPAAGKLAELQKMSVQMREKMFREAWREANGKEPPFQVSAMAQAWGLDILLEVVHRLRKTQSSEDPGNQQ